MVLSDMSTVSEACRKRNRTEKIYGFHSFGGTGCPMFFSDPFRDNIRQFLQYYAEIQEYSTEGMPTWCTVLIEENDGVAIPLYCVEESVKHSDSPFCEFCRCNGWSHHFVSKRRYHFIIPASDEWEKPLGAGKSPRGKVFNLQTHLLHGLIHCNGFGHLLSINGREAGSKHICGRDIMDLWDRICDVLHTREVTVDDVSKKRSMELRLLYSIAYGKPWFGFWGYKFLHGSFGVTPHKYEKATEILSELPLDIVINDFDRTKGETEVNRIIENYRRASETPLISLRDLLRFMLELKAGLPYHSKILLNSSKSSTVAMKRKIPAPEKKRPSRSISSLASDPSCRWSAKRMELAAQVIVGALKEHGANGLKAMTRQGVRDAARLHIGDTGLIDYVLKSLGDCVVGNQVVRRSVNHGSKVLEYTIEPIDGDSWPEEETSQEIASVGPVGRADVYKDLVYVYKHVIMSYKTGTATSVVLPVAVRTILDAKHLVKAWPFLDDEEDTMLRFMCSLIPAAGMEGEELTRPLPPPVLVVVPPYTTIGELKRAAGEALRDTYCIAERYLVSEVEGLEGEDEEVLFGVVESGVHLFLRGSGLDLTDALRYEGGADNWTVDCTCGARDDDGERMVSCDMCEVWQHTRCEGIDDAEVAPQLFLCGRCCRCGIKLLQQGIEIEEPPDYGPGGLV